MAFTNPYAPYQNFNPSYQTIGGANFSPYPSNQVNVQPQSNNGNMLTVFVNTEEEVNDYPVAAGTTVQLISFNLGKFYLKSTGTNGVPQPLRIFSFTEETPKNQNEPNLVSRDEFNALNSKLDKLIEELGGAK